MTPEWPDRLRLLCSFAYFRKYTPEDWDQYGDLDLLIDSGAFTAFTKGAFIDIKEYADWLLAHRSRITRAISLDVIGDWKATRANHERLEELIDGAVPLLPAWHLGSPTEELERLCETYDYVAIGGCVPYAKRPKLLMQHLVRAHRIARDRGTKLHGLGITGKTSMMSLPWASVDSSSYAQVHMFGQIVLTDSSSRMVSMQYGRRLTMAQKGLVRAYGGDPARVESKDFALIGKAGRELGQAERHWSLVASARSQLMQEGFLRRKHGSAFRLYFASTVHSWYIHALAEAHALGHPFEGQSITRKVPA